MSKSSKKTFKADRETNNEEGYEQIKYYSSPRISKSEKSIVNDSSEFEIPRGDYYSRTDIFRHKVEHWLSVNSLKSSSKKQSPKSRSPFHSSKNNHYLKEDYASLDAFKDGVFEDIHPLSYCRYIGYFNKNPRCSRPEFEKTLMFQVQRPRLSKCIMKNHPSQNDTYSFVFCIGSEKGEHLLYDSYEDRYYLADYVRFYIDEGWLLWIFTSNRTLQQIQ